MLHETLPPCFISCAIKRRSSPLNGSAKACYSSDLSAPSSRCHPSPVWLWIASKGKFSDRIRIHERHTYWIVMYSVGLWWCNFLSHCHCVTRVCDLWKSFHFFWKTSGSFSCWNLVGVILVGGRWHRGPVWWSWWGAGMSIVGCIRCVEENVNRLHTVLHDGSRKRLKIGIWKLWRTLGYIMYWYA